MCHVSHVYETGASLYFTFLARQREGGEVEQWLEAKRAAGEAIVRGGGTITHHHAIGRDHVPWMEREVGAEGIEVLRAVKERLDPAGIMNPGKLLARIDPLALRQRPASTMGPGRVGRPLVSRVRRISRIRRRWTAAAPRRRACGRRRPTAPGSAAARSWVSCRARSHRRNRAWPGRVRRRCRSSAAAFRGFPRCRSAAARVRRVHRDLRSTCALLVLVAGRARGGRRGAFASGAPHREHYRHHGGDDHDPAQQQRAAAA